MGTPNSTLEDRLRAVVDKLAIYHLIASHPPAADTGTESYYRNAFAADGVIDLGTKTATGNDKIGAVVSTPEHQAAIAGGLCHFAGLPRVTLDGDTAVAISYLQEGDSKKGLEHLQKALEAAPDTQRAQMIKGFIARIKQQMEAEKPKEAEKPSK